MSFHDAYARITPFELAFPDLDGAEERLARLRQATEEADRAGVLADPGRFLALPEAAEILRDIRDPRAGADALQKHGILLYHAFHFQEAGRPLFLVDTHAARYLVETAGGRAAADRTGDEERDPEEGGAREEVLAPPPPTPAGYAQLPRNLFWIRPSEDGPPEPVDGLFWSAPDGERIAVLVAAGMRDDRPGLSVVPLPGLPLEDAGTWLDAEIRPGGADFESTLPGGEMERLYSLEATGEVLKLLARLFRYLERFPEAVREEEPAIPEGARAAEAEAGEGGGPDPDESAAGEPAAPRASALEYRRISLDDASGPES